MYVVTGGAGFIGCNMVKFMNNKGIYNIVIIDNQKNRMRIEGKIKYVKFIDYTKGIENVINELKQFEKIIKVFFHIGAKTDVLIDDLEFMKYLNFEFSKAYLDFCIKNNIKFIYASTSAVYGNSRTFKVNKENEHPLNAYAKSKLMFDECVRTKTEKNVKIIGFRLFNVFGFDESHKGKNASIPYRFYKFLKEDEIIPIFNKEIQRDYINVEAVCQVFYEAIAKDIPNGIYNLGSCQPISHREIAELIIQTAIEMKLIEDKDVKNYIREIDIPKDLINKFQFYTFAEDTPYWAHQIIGNIKSNLKAYITQLCKEWQEET